LEALDLAVPEAPDAAQVHEAMRRHAIGEIDAHRLVFVNGRYWPQASGIAGGDPDSRTGDDTGGPPQLIPLTGPHVPEPVGRVVDFQRYRFALLNEALFDDGLLLRVPAGARPRPVYVLFLSLGGENPALLSPRLFLE